MSKVYSESVKRTTGTGTVDFPALAQSVRHVYRLDQPGQGGEPLTDYDPVSDGNPLFLATTLSYDAAGNLLAVRTGEDAEVEADAEALGSWCYMPTELDTDPDSIYPRTTWCDPSPGRWTKEDPLRFAADDLPLCRYVSDTGVQLPPREREAQQP